MVSDIVFEHNRPDYIFAEAIVGKCQKCTVPLALIRGTGRTEK